MNLSVDQKLPYFWLIVGCLSLLSACSMTPAREPGLAYLDIPLGISIASINHQPEGSLMIGAAQQRELTPGPVSIQFWYEQRFGAPTTGRKDIVRSTLHQLDFVAQAGQLYRIDYPRPTTYHLAKNALPNLTFTLLDHTNNSISTATPLDQQPAAMPVLQAAKDLMEQSQATPSPTSTVPDAASTTPSEHLQQLQILWHDTPDADREAFLRWILR